MRDFPVRLLWMVAVLLVMPGFVGAQSVHAPQHAETLAITGYSGQVPAVQMNGKTYVDIDALARLTHGTLSFQPRQITLTLPPSSSAVPSASVAPESKAAKQGFSPDFLRAAIEEMTEIREWRIAIVNAVQTNNPVAEDWVANFRRAAESKLTLASAAANSAAATESDRKALELLRNVFNNMRQLSDTFVTMRKNMTYTSPDSFDNNPLDHKILSCARSLASMAASNQFQDDSSCY